MRRFKQLTAVTLLGFLSLFWLMSPLHAFATDGIRAQASAIVVPIRENIDTVVSWGHPVIVQGTVTNSIIAVGSDITLTPTSESAFVFAVGGHVYQEAGAIVTDGILSIGADNQTLTTLALGGMFGVIGYIAYASLIALWFLIQFIGGYFVRERFGAVTDTIRAHPARLLLQGILLSVVPLVVVFASFVSQGEWILVLSGMVLLTYLMVGIGGSVLVATALGRACVKYAPPGWPRSAPLYGALGVLLCSNIPLVGPLFAIALWMLGLGAVWTAFRRPANVL